jgi:hypothetical protein
MLGLEGSSFEFAGFSGERLAAALTRAWEEREQARARMVPQVDAAKARARGAFDAVVARFIRRGGAAAP